MDMKNSLSQEEKLALRLKQVLLEAGFHEIRVFVTSDKQISFWVVKSEKVEGEVVDIPELQK